MELEKGQEICSAGEELKALLIRLRGSIVEVRSGDGERSAEQPPDHWVCVGSSTRWRLTLEHAGVSQQRQSVPREGKHVGLLLALLFKSLLAIALPQRLLGGPQAARGQPVLSSPQLLPGARLRQVGPARRAQSLQQPLPLLPLFPPLLLSLLPLPPPLSFRLSRPPPAGLDLCRPRQHVRASCSVRASHAPSRLLEVQTGTLASAGG